MRSGHLFVMFAAAIGFTTGCTESEQKFTLGDPSISILTTGPCDGVAAPVMNIDQVRAESFQDRTARVVVTGLDPRTPTGNLTSGTKMTLEFTDDEHLDIATFRSAGIDAILEPIKKTKAIPFSGRVALDEIICLRPGNVSVIAKVEKYVVDAEGDESRQVTLTTVPFPVRCLKTPDFSRYCSGLDLIDAGIDMGPSEADMATDAGVADAAPDMSRPPAWSISFVPPSNETDLEIGIRNSGFGRPDNVVLRFQVRDLNRTDDMSGAGLSDLPVSFSLSDNPPPDVAIEPEIARTDANGVASVRILAGGSPGVVSVTATADLGDGGPVEARSATIVIRGGIPSARGFQFQCATKVISAFEERSGPNDWRFGLSELDFSECFAQLSDRVSGRVDLSTQVFFMTEAGSVDQSSGTNETGIAPTTLRVGPPAPFDTTPNPYELEIDGRFNDTGFNPRDGLVTVVALTRGEEDFVDVNGNKIYEEGVDYQTPEQDLAEPFVDSDDNGTWTINNALVETFRDSFQPRDMMWTQANGKWDSDTEIWRETRVLWVGPFDEGQSKIDVECVPENGCNTEIRSPLCAMIDADYFLAPAGRISIKARMNDINGNCLSAYGEGSTYIAIDGPLEETSGIATNDFTGDCFLANKLTQPAPPTHNYEVIDTVQGMPDAPEIGRITVGVRYRGVGSRMHEAYRVFTTCR